MKGSRWRLLRPVRNRYLTLRLLLAIIIAGAVAAPAQENSRSSDPEQEIKINTSESNIRLPESCSKFLGASTSLLFIQNFLPKVINVIVFPSGIYPEVLSATIAPLGSDPSFPNAPGHLLLCIPPHDYDIVVNTGSEGAREKFHIKVLPSRNYHAEVTGSVVSSMGEHQPGPSSPDLIRSQIDRIANGAHQDLPVPTQTSTTRGQNPGWSIENATGYQLHMYLSGPSERDYIIPNGKSINIDLSPGTYRIAADVSNKGVIPFYAVRQLDSNVRWTSHFYIGRQ
jgi:hypothetical protein